MISTLSSFEFAQFNALIETNLGICFDIKRIYLLEQALQERVQALGCSDFSEYYLLLYDAPRLGEWKKLAPLLTIGETYFFRGDTHTTALSEYIIPQIVQSRQKKCDPSPIRILSCGCSTGEEPYTIALLFQELFPHVKFEITAIDLNPASLKIAKKGVYSARSVNLVPTRYLVKYFQIKRKYRKRDEFHLNPEIKNQVHFQEGNLVDPHFYENVGSVDLLLCRNVLIYFAPDTIRIIISRFRSILHSDSFLVLGHSENVKNYSDDFEVIDKCDTFFYRTRREQEVKRKLQTSPLTPSAASSPTSTPPHSKSSTLVSANTSAKFSYNKREALKELLSQTELQNIPETPRVPKPMTLEEEYSLVEQEFLNELFQKTKKRLQKILAENPRHQRSLLLQALLQLKKGDFDDAKSTCEAIQKFDEFSAETYCVQGVIYEAFDDPKSAKKCYKNALFLGQNCAVAHFKLAQIHNSSRQVPAARKSYQNTLKYLEAQSDNAFRLYSGGFSKKAAIAICDDFLSL